MTKERITISIDDTILKWIDSQINKKEFANRSHCFEKSVTKLMEKK